MTASFDILRWNHAYAEIFGDPGEVAPEHRNALRSLLMNPNIREGMQDWTDEVSDAVARFGFESGKYPGDPTFAALITELTSNSQRFRELWRTAVVRPFAERDLLMQHREHGTLQLSKIELRPVDQPSFVLTVFRPATDATREVVNTVNNRRGNCDSFDDRNVRAAAVSVATA